VLLKRRKVLIDYILNFQFNSVLAIWLYWVPLLVCTVYSIGAIYYDAQDDLKNRDSTSYYREKLTIGTILLRVIGTIAPGWNLVAAIFHTAPAVLRHVFDICGNILSIPLIPKRNK
jgi:hypothetical protein